ncbi:hypothetical protein [Actinosynnema sp. ALI-1.44]|uniref:hypothetical protein n=1 Tax=Actinosynnema sp. ALI-1.44 TaxID=1933779 RepID=UPI001EDBCA11|nr:hypothetical protein [Actinosynnema sp. ALI-1.44]
MHRPFRTRAAGTNGDRLLPGCRSVLKPLADKGIRIAGIRDVPLTETFVRTLTFPLGERLKLK